VPIVSEIFCCYKCKLLRKGCDSATGIPDVKDQHTFFFFKLLLLIAHKMLFPYKADKEFRSKKCNRPSKHCKPVSTWNILNIKFLFL